MITAGGVGSGIDINGLVAQLVLAEAEPTVARFDRKEANYQAELSAFGLLKGALSEFRTTLSGLKSASAFQASAATSADADVFTATASPDAVPGQYSVEVVRLAESHKLVSKGLLSVDTEVGTGVLSISTGGNFFEVTIDDSNKTLAGVRDAINAAAGNTSVAATIVNVDDKDGNTVSKLVLAASGTGSSSEITVATLDDDLNHIDGNGLSQLAHDPKGSGAANLSEIRPAIDAQIKVDGQTVTRSSNTISDAIDGVTIELVSAAPGQAAALTIAVDQSKAVEAVNGFVESFNSLVGTLRDVASFNPETGVATALFGDSTVRTISSGLRRELAAEITSVTANFSTLAEIGITTDRNGRLSVDSAALDRALETNLDAVADLFAADDGYASRLDVVLEGLVSSSGIIDARTEGLNARIDDIATQRVALDRRLDALEQRLLSQFTAMDALVGQLRATSDFLTQQLGVLQSIASRGSGDNSS